MKQAGLWARWPVGRLARVHVGRFGWLSKQQNQLNTLQAIKSNQRYGIPAGESNLISETYLDEIPNLL